MLPGILSEFRSLPGYKELLRRLPRRQSGLSVCGLPGSSPVVMLATLAEDFPQRVFLVVTDSPSDAERWFADLEVLVPDVTRLYPQIEAVGGEETHYEVAGERVETVAAILGGDAQVVVSTLRATAELTYIPRAVVEWRMEIRRNSEIRPAEVAERLERMGYEVRPSVSDVAQFAVRGGIIDVYGFGMAAPTRLEWCGDRVVSTRSFDLTSQRSLGEVDAVTVLPVKCDVSAAGGEEVREGSTAANADHGRSCLFELLPSDTLVLGAVGRLGEIETLWDEAEHHIEVARWRGEDVSSRETLFLSPGSWASSREKFARIEFTEAPANVDFAISVPDAVDRDMGRLRQLVSDFPSWVLCDNEGQLERLEELLSDPRAPKKGPPASVTLALGSLHGGFVMPRLMVLTDHEIFRRARRIRRARRYTQALVGSSDALKPGDYVVHLEHGIGIFRGLDTIQLAPGSTIEVSVIEYEGGDRLNVPMYRVDQIERYRSFTNGEQAPPKLDRLGGSRWKRQRGKTQSVIRKMAVELMELYSRRAIAEGFPFPQDDRWQSELESSFLYEDTPDQRHATDVIKRDMEKATPMDRLIVGDVGYGKTEVAVRAAFKAVVGGKQVGVLVPTTILAEQHGTTFSERMATFPVRIEVLSRFRSSAQQREIVEGIKAGTVDIVIGTHRLLSRDVAFKDLGLLIVDEEHRFGVRHKELIKQLRLQVDVLTLTATPIPRTLHFALSGLRDLTLIETPPRDRSPVLTFIEPWDDVLLEEVIARELDRGGQVFFVHNRVATIDTMAARVERLAPKASVAVGHGQMRERELDEVMRDFVAGSINVLVSTMIVETGLDVPNANTMIVSQAEQFGLAQLHQLRGRVGRGHRRAYCYLLVGDNLDLQVEERLRLLEHHTELGSGYQLALRDLEQRGAGNLLGAEQSGHAHKVGVHLYLRWLGESVAALKGEAAGQSFPAPEVYCDGPANLPDSYVPDDNAKFDFYRRLARMSLASEIAQLREELRDRFGAVPQETERLLLVAELRLLGKKLGIESIGVRGDTARVTFRHDSTPRLTKLTAALDDVQFAAEVRRAAPLSLRLTRLGGLGIGQGLVRALKTAIGENETAAVA